jgi:hypothetical protein
MSTDTAMHQRKTRKLATMLLTLVVVLVAGEVVARVFLRSHWDTESLKNQLGHTSIRSLIELDDDVHVRYRLRKRLDTSYQESRVITDDSGVRIGASPQGDSAGSIRVALLGDSTPFGWRVDYEDSFAEKLRRELETLSGQSVVLRNFSVPGYNADQEHHVFLKSVAAFQPQLLIVHHDHNDAQPTGWGYTFWMPPEYGDNPLHSAFVKLVLRQLRKIHDKSLPAAEEGHDEYLGEYSFKGPLYEAMMDSRKALSQAARERGIPVLVLIFNSTVPADSHYETSEPFLRLHAPAARRFLEMGYFVLDMYPAYQRMLAQSGAKDMRDLWMDAEDHHPNPRGHSFIADTLLHFIQDTPQLKQIFTQAH